MEIMESRLQKGIFIYKAGISFTKQDFHLQIEILELQTGISGYYLPDYMTLLWKNKEKLRKSEWIIFLFIDLCFALWYNIYRRTMGVI